jgi:hypothetical protein
LLLQEEIRSTTILSVLTDGVSAEAYIRITDTLNEFNDMTNEDANGLSLANLEVVLRTINDEEFQTDLLNEDIDRTTGLSAENEVMNVADTQYLNTLSSFGINTDDQLSGVTFDSNTYSFISDINVSGHYLYLGSTWRIYGTELSSIFQMNYNGTWKNVVVFNKN